MSIIRKARISADKRSIDAYGRSIELAIAGYLLDTGKFPTEVSQLTIEYSGSQVVCSTTQINTDSSVYLAGCIVAGRSVDGYTYGKEETVSYKAYSIGDEISYNNVDYYVIKDSSVSDSTVTLLKAEPLSAEEITTYSAGTGAQTDGNGGMEYHSSSSAYEGSYVKTTVDAWKNDQAPAANEARIITYEELTTELGCTSNNCANSLYDWLYNIGSWCWTMSPVKTNTVWFMFSNGALNSGSNGMYNLVVRPVIVLSKSAL